EKYPNKKILDWVYYHQYLNDDDLPIYSNAQKIVFNDYLLSQGKDYVIYFHELKDEEATLEGIKNIVNGENPPDLLSGFYKNKLSITDSKEDSKDDNLGMINQGLFLELNTLKDNEFYKKYINEFSDVEIERSKINGKLYGVMQNEIGNVADYYVINSNIAKQCGLDSAMFEKKEIDEIMPYLEKVLQKEKNESDFKVIDYYPGYKFLNIIGGIGSMGADDTFRMLSIGRDQSQSEIDKITNGKLIKEYYEDKFKLDRLGYTSINNYTGDNEKFDRDDENDTKNANVFLCLYSYDIVNKTEILSDIQHKFGKVENIDIVYKCDAPEQINALNNILTGICSKSENVEKAMEALAFINGDKEATQILYYGVEGKDYEVEKNKIECNSEELMNVEYRKSYLGNIFKPRREVGGMDYEKIKQQLKKMSTDKEVGGDYYNLENLEAEVNKVQEVENKYLWSIIYENESDGLYDPKYRNFDEAWNDFDRQLKEAGIDKIIKEVRKQYEEYNK
ncbi:DUF3502 domain-containing protein, partial [Eubacterium sp.]